MHSLRSAAVRFALAALCLTLSFAPWIGVGAGVGVGVGPAVAGVAAAPPLADAGLDQRVARGSTVFLDGTGSRAATAGGDDDPGLAYAWTVRAPDGERVAVADA